MRSQLPELVERIATYPQRLAAPLGLLAKRAGKAEFWVEKYTEHREPGPDITLTYHADSQPPSEGAGPLNHRRYRVEIVGSDLNDLELLAAFRSDPNLFSPTSFARFETSGGHSAVRVGDEIEVTLPGPWNGPVLVAESSEQLLRLETMTGHMEAGWIEFSTELAAGVVRFEIESLARSGDVAFDVLYHTVGVARLVQTEMWVQVLESAVRLSGGRQQGRIRITTDVYPELSS